MPISKNKKNKKKPQKKLFRVDLFNSESRAKREYFSNLTCDQIYSNFSKVCSHMFFRGLVARPRKNLRRIFYYEFPYVEKDAAEKKLYWLLAVIGKNQIILERMMEKEGALLSCIFKRNWREAEILLDEVDAVCGFSLWSYKVRSFLASVDTEGNNYDNYFENVKGQIQENYLLEYILEDFRNKFKNAGVFSTSIQTYYLHLNRVEDKKFRDFLLNELLPFDPEYDYDYDYIMSMVATTSIVDIYVFIKQYICSMVANKDKKQTLDLEKVVKLYKNLISQTLAKDLANCFQLEKGWDLNLDHLTLVDCYTKGDYHAVCERLNSIDYPSYDFSILELGVKSNLRSKNLELNGVQGEISIAMESILSRDDDYQRSSNYLSYISYNLRSFSWFRSLALFLNQEKDFISEKSKKYVKNLILLNSEANTPMKSTLFEDGAKREFILSVFKVLENSSTANLFDIYQNEKAFEKDELLGIDITRFDFYKAKYYKERGEYSESIIWFKTLIESRDKQIQKESLRGLVDCLIADNRLEEALEQFVNTWIYEDSKAYIFDLEGT